MAKAVVSHSHLVIVTSPKVNHDMFVPIKLLITLRNKVLNLLYAPIKEHDRARIV